MRACESVTLVNFGGTIDMAGTEGIHPGAGVADALADLPPAARQIERHDPFRRPPDSTNVGPTEWAVLLELLSELRDRKLAAAAELRARGRSAHPAGIVVTHGTDTMAYTSLVAALTLNAGLPFPIVFTGAWAPHAARRSDARSNLRKALAVARADVPSAVYVLIGEDLHLPSRLVKVRTEPDADGKYFFSFPSPAGRVQGIDTPEITFHPEGLGEDVPPPTWSGGFGYVEHLVVDVSTPPSVLADARRRLAAHPGRRGLVIQGNFRRHHDLPAMVEGLARLAEDGALLFLGSREAVEAARALRPALAVDLLEKSLRHTTAWTKLTWLLGTALDDDAVRAAMRVSLVGDVFTTHELPQWTRYETFPPGGADTAVVVVTPALDPAQIVDAAARLGAGGELHLYGFGHGHLPGPNRPVAEVVAEALGQSLPPCETLGAVVVAVATRLAQDPALRARVLAGYEARPVAVAQLLRRRETEALVARLRAALWERVEAAGTALLAANDAAWGELDELRTHVAARAPIHLTPAAQRTLGDRQRARAALPPAAAVELLLAEAPDAVAMRLIVDAVRGAAPALAAIGAARDRGIVVRMGSLSVGAHTDLTRYEVGTWLHVVGVDGDRSRGWDCPWLRPR